MSDSEQNALFCDRAMSQPTVRPLAGGTAALFTAPAPGKQGPNEDAAALIPLGEHTGVAVVADGMGGERAGEQAAMLTVRAVAAAVREATDDTVPLRDAILNGIERANHAVCELALGAATTVAIVAIDHGEARPYHVGDSMILIVGQRGRMKLQTVCHSPVGFAVEAGLLGPAEAIHHEHRHLVSNVIGTPDMRIEMGSTLRLAPRDTLLLASDGLFDNLHLAEIVARIRAGRLERAACRLVHDARQRMTQPADDDPSKPDDLTFIAFRRTVEGGGSSGR